jgi:drug/metabolite transporter (DMT)-like permease
MEKQHNNWINWALFGIIALIWGSSFILMKLSMFAEGQQATLSPYQVAALRMLSAGLILLPVALRALSSIPREKLFWMLTSGVIGSFFPAFFFCLAETRIDSSLAGFLNALTPVFTLIVGTLFFGLVFPRHKVLGVLLAFCGMCLLFMARSGMQFNHLAYATLVVAATICYGFNVNIATRYLTAFDPVQVVAIAFSSLIIPSLLVLGVTGFFALPFEPAHWRSIGAATVLGVLNTAIASLFFYHLMKRAGPLFASMVTYGIPFIALWWGWLAGEQIGAVQLSGLGIILIGVFLTNK